MSPFILKYAKWRNVLILLSLIVVINILLALSLGNNPKLKPLDLEFSYSPSKAYEMLAMYNEHERSIYVLVELTLDILYPIIYSLCLSFALLLLYGKMKLAKLPLFLVVFELLENACITLVLVNYPHQHPWIIQIASLFTSMKWILALFCVATILVGGLLKLMRK